jgi:NAD(P)-dependent dehydrogenase (short-subunit alcohol dehydrogenase family)
MVGDQFSESGSLDSTGGSDGPSTRDQDFQGRVGIVTGAAGGIGRAMSSALLARGAQVVLADSNLSGLDEVVGLLNSTDRVRSVKIDVGSEDDVEKMVRLAVSEYGRLDFAINNAGIAGRPETFVDVSLDTWNRTIAINLTSVFLCMRAELRPMLAQGSGAIVNVASTSALRPTPGMPHYVASKNGVLGLTRSAAIEYGPRGVRTNTLIPGSIDTPMIRETLGDDPVTIQAVKSRWVSGRMGLPEEAALAAVWLCSPEASFVNGASIVVDGGMLHL